MGDPEEMRKMIQNSCDELINYAVRKPSMNKEGYANLVQNIHVKIIPSVIC